MTSPPPKKKGNIKYIKIKYVFSQKPNRTTKKKTTAEICKTIISNT